MGEIQSINTSKSPAEMIEKAVSGGADLDKLEKLLSLQERWEANEAKKAYNVAMAEFKKNPPKIEKDKKVGYSTQKGNVGYSHATLANVVEKITKELSKHGLSASWKTTQNGAVTVTCIITHLKGHSEETTLSAPSDSSGSKNAIQAIGSTITYLERYTLLAALGLATHDQDDDGQSVETVDDKQLNTLRDMLIAIDAKESGLLKYLKIDKLENLRKNDYQKAVAAIEAKARNQEAGAK